MVLLPEPERPTSATVFPLGISKLTFSNAGFSAPVYTVVSRNGPAHQTSFCVEVRAGNQSLGNGKGRSKKLAERAAAEDALLAERFLQLDPKVT